MNAMRRYAILSAVTLLALAGCSKDPVTPGGGGQSTPVLGIDELILITASGWEVPDFTTGAQHTFDLSSVALVQDGEYGDFEVRYTTFSSCDVDVDVFNFNVLHNDWDRIGFAPEGTPICLAVQTGWSRTLSEQALQAEDHVNDDLELVIRASVTPSVRALKLNPNYDPIALNPLAIGASGIDIVGSTIWLAGDALHRVTTGGAKQPDVPTPLTFNSGLAYDGELFWTVDRSGSPWGRFYGFTPTGDEGCTFAGSDDWETNDAMVYARGLLWAFRPGHSHILGIDLEASCNADFITEDQVIAMPFGGTVTALAYDGTNFWVAVDGVVRKVSPAGMELEDHPFTVQEIVDMVYTNGSLWILHTGPLGVATGGQFLTRFKI